MSVDVSSLRILQYPDPALRRRARPIDQVTPEVRDVAEQMIALMRQAEGIGLAAPQVGLDWRLFVVHVPAGEDHSIESDPPTATPEPQVYINPTLGPLQGDIERAEEGCLSLPEIHGDVGRPPRATIKALDLDGNEFVQTAAGLLARCWQHEHDHLDGVLIIDRMTQMSRLKTRSAVRALEKAARARS